MNDIPDPNERIDALESHIAHQDSTLQDLSGVVLEQWRAIKAMEEKMVRLEAQMQALEDAMNRPAGEDPPPPHY